MIKLGLKILIVGATVLIASCGMNAVEKIKLSSKDSLPDLFVREVEVLYSDSAKLRMKLNAPEVKDFTQTGKGYTIFPKGLDVIFYDKSNRPEASLRADYGYHHSQTDLWEYKGKVKIINVNGDTLRTEHLFANRTKDSLYTNEPVEIKMKNGSNVKGKGGYNSNLSFTRYQFKEMQGSKLKL